MAASFHTPLHPSVLTHDLPDLDDILARDPTIFDRLLTPADAADLLGLAEGTLRQMRSSSYTGRSGPAFVKNGSRACYRVRDVIDYARTLDRFQIEDPSPLAKLGEYA